LVAWSGFLLELARFLSLTDSEIPATRHLKVSRCIARNLYLSSNVRIKRARHMPEFSILHRVCDRWNMRLVIEIRRCGASLPTIADCRSLGSPAKFDGVYMAFDRRFVSRSGAPTGGLTGSPSGLLFRLGPGRQSRRLACPLSPITAVTDRRAIRALAD
jgi:hypothetical protein